MGLPALESVQCPRKRSKLNQPYDEETVRVCKLPSPAAAAGGTMERGVHPYGVQPWGNFLAYRGPDRRSPGLGQLALLSDANLLEILYFLQGDDIARLSSLSAFVYALCHHNEVWRRLVLTQIKSDIEFHENWRLTFALHYAKASKASVPPHVPLQLNGVFSDDLFQSWVNCSLSMKHAWLHADNIDRRSNLSIEDFIRDYEEPNLPVVITDVACDWKAVNKWNLDFMSRKFGDVKMNVQAVDMSLRDYCRYASATTDESPLYIFEKRFATLLPAILDDFSVPKYFDDDLFPLLGERRPDYRWIIGGPARSGSTFHKDPNSTNAWNAVLCGSKKWIMFPPDIVPPGVVPSDDGAEVATPFSLVEWFSEFYQIAKRGVNGARMRECIVGPGEMMFVPRGWWHCVYNLEESVAITQNYVSPRNLLHVLDFCRESPEQVSGTSEPELLHQRLLDCVESQRPGLRASLEAKRDADLRRRSVWHRCDAARTSSALDKPFAFNFDSSTDTPPVNTST